MTEQCCRTCKLFRTGKTLGSANPELTRGHCLWLSSFPLPFWLWDNYRPVPIDGDDCKTWESRKSSSGE